MLGIELIDWLTIAGYLVGITIIGVWAVKRVKSAASFFISDRKFGKIMMMFFSFGAGTHSDQAVSVAAKTYRVGASGIWYQWLWLFVTPFYWLLAPMFRRMRAVTTGDYFYARYDKSVGMLFAIVGVLQLMVNIGVMLKGSSAMVTAVSGGAINPNLAIWAMTAIFVIYGVAGGLAAAIITNFIQGLLTIVLSFMILPFAMSLVGGIGGLKETIADPGMFSIVDTEITLFYVTVISINGLIGWVTQPHNMCTSAAGKTEMEGRIGVMCGNFIKRFCTIAWTLTGLCAIAIYMGKNVDVDQVYGLMARDLLPKIAPGLVGLFIASMLAAVMSSCDTFMVSSSGLFTENIYKPLIAPGKKDSHYVLVGRITSAIVVLAGIFFAYQFESVVHALEVFWKISAMMGMPFLIGLFWRKATAKGAWAGTLVSFVILLFTSKVGLLGWDFNAVLADKLPQCMQFMLFEGKLYLPWQMILYLAAGLVATIVVSLFTKPTAKEKLDKFYKCLRTPVQPNEPETEPFTLPQGVEPGPRNVFIKHPDFEIPKPSFVSVIGFLAGWAMVGLLVWIFFL
ncbi:MAG: sodium:solute symporter family protein, partial [Planctomycetota bacterium]